MAKYEDEILAALHQNTLVMQQMVAQQNPANAQKSDVSGLKAFIKVAVDNPKLRLQMHEKLELTKAGLESYLGYKAVDAGVNPKLPPKEEELVFSDGKVGSSNEFTGVNIFAEDQSRNPFYWEFYEIPWYYEVETRKYVARKALGQVIGLVDFATGYQQYDDSPIGNELKFLAESDPDTWACFAGKTKYLGGVAYVQVAVEIRGYTGSGDDFPVPALVWVRLSDVSNDQDELTQLAEQGQSGNVDTKTLKEKLSKAPTSATGSGSGSGSDNSSSKTGVGLLFTSIFPNAINQDSNLNNQQPDPNVQQQQLQRTGQNILWIVGLAIVGIGFKENEDDPLYVEEVADATDGKGYLIDGIEQNAKIIEFKPDKKKTKPKLTANQKKAQDNVRKVNKLAVQEIYNAGKTGKDIPAWGDALRKAAKKVYK
ncbi:hypothetical protein U1Q18_050164 [Sarracenia purpurea var. burkii]